VPNYYNNSQGAFLYDPESRQWGRTDSIITLRWNYSMTLLPSGRVLVAGGSREGHFYSYASTVEYVPDTGTWFDTDRVFAARFDGE
jgi:hypothetical protein